MSTVDISATVSSLKTRITAIDTFLSKLEAAVLQVPEDIEFEINSDLHLRYTDLYLKMAAQHEKSCEAFRKAAIVEMELLSSSKGSRETDELYRMLKTLPSDEVSALIQSYRLLKTPAISNDALSDASSVKTSELSFKELMLKEDEVSTSDWNVVDTKPKISKFVDHLSVDDKVSHKINEDDSSVDNQILTLDEVKFLNE